MSFRNLKSQLPEEMAQRIIKLDTSNNEKIKINQIQNTETMFKIMKCRSNRFIITHRTHINVKN